MEQDDILIGPMRILGKACIIMLICMTFPMSEPSMEELKRCFQSCLLLTMMVSATRWFLQDLD